LRVAIVGGGISGLSLAYFLQKKADVTIFEKEHFGGKARSVKVEGALFEEGVNGFLSNSPLTFEVAKEIGLTPIKANENSKIRYIYDDKLYKIPSPKEFLKSDILPWYSKLRILMDFFVEPICDREESVEEFARRRFGKNFARRFITPMVAGIYAARADEISIDAAFLKLKEIECEYGSLIKAMIKRKKGGSPSGELYSFEGGMSEFIEKLKNNTKAEFIKKEINSLDELKGFDKIVLAIPAYEAAKLVDDELKTLLEKIEYSPVGVVGFKEELEPKGFGVLTIKEKSLGVLMDKYIFPNREGFRVMVGGSRFKEIVNLSEEEVKEIVKSDIEKIFGISPNIVFYKMHKKAIPLYKKGHKKLVDEVMKKAKEKNLYLTGNAYRGVSFNECIKNSFSLSKEIV
jgi:oxygen-dependent protoporphyrinogen oxidase